MNNGHQPALDIPPQNCEAERALIGSVFLAGMPGDLIDETGIRRDHFYADANAKIWDAVLYLHSKHKPIDAVTVATELDRRKHLVEVGDVKYLASLMETVPNASHGAYYASLVFTAWKSRQAVFACRDLTELAYSCKDHEEINAKAEEALKVIAETGAPQRSVEIGDVLIDVWNSIQTRFKDQQAVGLRTGWEELDRLLVALGASDLSIVAARPSIGKTSFACCLALQAAEAGVVPFVQSLEMNKLELAERLLCAEGHVDAHDVKAGSWSGNVIEQSHKAEALQHALSRLQELPIIIEDTPGLRLQQIAANARRAKRKYGIGLIIVDYLQLVEPADHKVPREQQVALISKGFKNLARELEVPVVLLAQLNRGVENREDKRPRLADLRESGAIEQDADVVMFLHRPEVYDPEDRPGEADVIVAKNRRGRVGTCTLHWNAASTQFLGMARTRDAEYDNSARMFATAGRGDSF
jgi:replicative DNA helicase